MASFAEEDQAEVLAASRDELAAIIESDLEAFLDYDFSNSTCQAIFSSGTVDPAASAEKPAAAAAAPAGDLVSTELWASLDL